MSVSYYWFPHPEDDELLERARSMFGREGVLIKHYERLVVNGVNQAMQCGYAFSLANEEMVKDLIEFDDDESTMQRTATDIVLALTTFRIRPAEGEVEDMRVIINSEAMECGTAILRPVVKEFAKRIGKDVLVRNIHQNMGKREDALSNYQEWFKILFWSLPPCMNMSMIGSRTYGKLGQNTIYGIRTDSCQGDGSNVDLGMFGGDVIESPEGDVVGLLEGDILHIPFDLPHAIAEPYKANSAILLKHILEDVTTERTPLSEEEKESRRMEHIVGGILSGIETQKATIKSEMDGLTTQITNSLEQIAGFAKQRFEKLQFLRVLDGKTITPEQIKAEVKKLKGISGVEKVTLGSVITIETGRIDFEHKGIVRLGHRYKIILNVLAQSVRIEGIGNPHDNCRGYFHPHVNGSNPCWGNIGGAVYDYMNSMEFVALTSLVMQYLEVANETDWYINPERWPIAEDVPQKEWKCPECNKVYASLREAKRCSLCGLCGDCCDCWTCVNCDRRHLSGDFHCSGCDGCEDCCNCWTCEGCGNQYGEDEERCPDCDRCLDCCSCDRDEDEEEEDDI